MPSPCAVPVRKPLFKEEERGDVPSTRGTTPGWSARNCSIPEPIPRFQLCISCGCVAVLDAIVKFFKFFLTGKFPYDRLLPSLLCAVPVEINDLHPKIPIGYF